MTGTLNELKLYPDFKIRKGSIVRLALPEHRRPLRVEIIRIFWKDDNTFIEAIKYGSKLTGIHDARIYRDYGTLIKF